MIKYLICSWLAFFLIGTSAGQTSSTSELNGFEKDCSSQRLGITGISIETSFIWQAQRGDQESYYLYESEETVGECLFVEGIALDEDTFEPVEILVVHDQVGGRKSGIPRVFEVREGGKFRFELSAGKHTLAFSSISHRDVVTKEFNISDRDLGIIVLMKSRSNFHE